MNCNVTFYETFYFSFDNHCLQGAPLLKLKQLLLSLPVEGDIDANIYGVNGLVLLPLFRIVEHEKFPILSAE